MKKGITFAGNILVDVVKTMNGFPNIGMLATITDVKQAVGGAVPNTAIDVAKIDPTVPIKALGRIGDDAYGQYLTKALQSYGIDTAGVLVTPDAPTSFSDVMSDISTGERTFFHARGANALFSPEDVDVDALDCDIFHIGYILLLDKMDEADPEYGTRLASLLKRVQERGIKTSIDVVSESSARFREKVVPALKYCNYAIMNEIEACGVSGLDPRKADGSLDIDNLRKTMEMMMELGVKERVIVHSKEAGCMLSADGSFRFAYAVDIAKEKIAGKVGAGDAFCAGSLYGLYTGIDDDKLLDFASAAAVCNITAADSISGMRSKDELWKIVEAGVLE